MELTKEYFDEQLATLATKRDLERLATKQDIIELRIEMTLKFDAVLELLDVRAEVAELAQQMNEVRRELKLA